MLLVLADDAFGARWRNQTDFSLVAAVDEPPPERRSRSWLVVAATVGMIVLASLGIFSLFEAAALAAVAVIAGGAISIGEGWRAINLNVVLTMAVAISLGAAVTVSGLADQVAELVGRAESLGFGDVGIVVAIMLATIVLTELVTNTAAAALMVPVGITIANEVGMDPKMLAYAVLVGASCSFLSPVGYQTNLMVFGLGGYKFTDFTRVGFPVDAVDAGDLGDHLADRVRLTSTLRRGSGPQSGVGRSGDGGPGTGSGGQAPRRAVSEATCSRNHS